jgi:hypothetical protein
MKNALATLSVLLLVVTSLNADLAEPVLPDRAKAGETVEATEALEISAPKTAKVGELVIMTVGSEADSIKWITPTKDFATFENGRIAVFSARSAGEYRFICSISANNIADVKEVIIYVKGPPKPPTGNDLSEWIPFWVASMDLDASVAQKLAGSFEAVANSVTPLSTPAAIIKATKEANLAALGPAQSEFKPLLAKIKASLANLAKQGKLQTAEQHKIVWLQIAKGLRNVK